MGCHGVTIHILRALIAREPAMADCTAEWPPVETGFQRPVRFSSDRRVRAVLCTIAVKVCPYFSIGRIDKNLNRFWQFQPAARIRNFLATAGPIPRTLTVLRPCGVATRTATGRVSGALL